MVRPPGRGRQEELGPQWWSPQTCSLPAQSFQFGRGDGITSGDKLLGAIKQTHNYEWQRVLWRERTGWSERGKQRWERNQTGWLKQEVTHILQPKAQPLWQTCRELLTQVRRHGCQQLRCFRQAFNEEWLSEAEHVGHSKERPTKVFVSDQKLLKPINQMTCLATKI